MSEINTFYPYPYYGQNKVEYQKPASYGFHRKLVFGIQPYCDPTGWKMMFKTTAIDNHKFTETVD